MRTVKVFDLGTVMTTGASESIIAVAHDGVFSHAHYVRQYGEDSEDHRHLNAYTAEEVIDDVRRLCPWRNKEIALRAVGLA